MALNMSITFEGDGGTIFEHACSLGLEGIVCKRIDAPYRAGRVGREAMLAEGC